MPDVISDIFVSESALPVDSVLPSAAWAESERVIVNNAARVFKLNTGRRWFAHGVVGRLADVIGGRALTPTSRRAERIDITDAQHWDSPMHVIAAGLGIVDRLRMLGPAR